MTVAIVFTKNYKVKDDEGLEYLEGCIYAVPPASARHFIKRGVAEYTDVEPPEETEPKDVEEYDSPEFDLPKHAGGGMWELPDGRRIKGKKEAFSVFRAGRTLDDPPLDTVEVDDTMDPVME